LIKWLAIIVVLALAGLMTLPGLWGHRASAVNAVGSTSIQPFAEMLSQEFNKTHPECIVDVQGGGSTAGLQAADEGIAQIGMCSRLLKTEQPRDGEKSEAQKFAAVTIARDGLALVVHPSNRRDSRTIEQIRRMFAEGSGLDAWQNVGVAGAPNGPIRLITREEGSGTREAFQKLVMGKARISRKALTQESNGAVKELVKHDPNAIGYMSLGLVHDELKILRIDGQVPTTASVKDGSYPLVRPFLFVTKGPPTPEAQRFIDYVLSPHGQRLLEAEGLVSAK
jgi:phosphate transport system substrate-binding protein